MNIMTVKKLGSTLVLLGVLSGCKASQAPETTTDNPAPAAETPAATAMPAPAPAPAAEAEAAPITIPDSADGIWQAIDEHSAQLKATVQSGSLESVHLHAFAIRDLVAALPARSPTLPDNEQTKLQGEMKFVATLADRLDETGDAGDKAGTQANYDKLVTVLNGITRTK